MCRVGGSHPYAVVMAGLAALEGTRHGGLTARVEAMLDGMRRAPHVHTALGARLRRGETIDGFGHPLYPNGDPRAAALLGLLRDRYGKSRELAFVLDVAEAAASIIRDKPTIDFALAALARVLRLPSGSALTLFAIGRTIGWIGHAIEQRARPGSSFVRGRVYVGAGPIETGEDLIEWAEAPAGRSGPGTENIVNRPALLDSSFLVALERETAVATPCQHDPSCRQRLFSTSSTDVCCQ
jgi:citrate synthase